MKKPMQEEENSVDKSSENSGQVAGARAGGVEVVPTGNVRDNPVSAGHGETQVREKLREARTFSKMVDSKR